MQLKLTGSGSREIVWKAGALAVTKLLFVDGGLQLQLCTFYVGFKRGSRIFLEGEQ